MNRFTKTPTKQIEQTDSMDNIMLVEHAKNVVKGALEDGLFDAERHMAALSIVQLNESGSVYQRLDAEEEEPVRDLAKAVLDNYVERNAEPKKTVFGRTLGRIAVWRGMHSDTGVSAQMILAHTDSDRPGAPAPKKRVFAPVQAETTAERMNPRALFQARKYPEAGEAQAPVVY